MRLMIILLVGLCGGMLGGGCRTMPAEDVPTALRVGVTPDYPPLVFKQQKRLTGAEVELARALARKLDRPAQFIELRWDDQINALLTGKIDIIMSGMTITDTRRVRIEFTEPWLQLGLMALVRSRDTAKYPGAIVLMAGDAGVGVQKDSTAAVFVNRNYRGINSITYLDPLDAPYYLTSRKIDAFIHDGPALIWMASENEAELAVLPYLMTADMIAWGVRKDDDELLREVNAVLAGWRQDGTIDRVVEKWLPLPRGLVKTP
ncbi:MAG: ABC transporter substrate-binding protein [Kiritimatiellia bacterium]|nr:ABC transporter substrate-binding protein [Lentisphaerota bacterium]